MGHDYSHSHGAGALRSRQHDADSAGIHESEIRSGAEQERETKHITIEVQCRVDVSNRHGDLADVRHSWLCGHGDT